MFTSLLTHHGAQGLGLILSLPSPLTAATTTHTTATINTTVNTTAPSAATPSTTTAATPSSTNNKGIHTPASTSDTVRDVLVLDNSNNSHSNIHYDAHLVANIAATWVHTARELTARLGLGQGSESLIYHTVYNNTVYNTNGGGGSERYVILLKQLYTELLVCLNLMGKCMCTDDWSRLLDSPTTSTAVVSTGSTSGVGSGVSSSGFEGLFWLHCSHREGLHPMLLLSADSYKHIYPAQEE